VSCCQCNVCKRGAVVYARLQLLPKDQREFWENLYDELLHVELDRDVNAAIIDGSWTDADAWIAQRRARVASYAPMSKEPTPTTPPSPEPEARDSAADGARETFTMPTLPLKEEKS
jgi:hypothetical protein